INDRAGVIGAVHRAGIDHLQASHEAIGRWHTAYGEQQVDVDAFAGSEIQRSEPPVLVELLDRQFQRLEDPWLGIAHLRRYHTDLTVEFLGLYAHGHGDQQCGDQLPHLHFSSSSKWSKIARATSA